jgi:DNA-binding GntR family transcriptional regulator
MTSTPASSEVALNRVSTVEAVAESIRERILGGELAPGTELREVELSSTYGVGRHSIRAAIQALAHSGLVRHVPHRGAFVPQLTVDEVSDVYALRSALEHEAVRRLLLRPADVDLPDSVMQALARLERLPPHTGWSEVLMVDLDVHLALVEAVGSTRMRKTYIAMLDELRLCLSQWPQRSDPNAPGIDEGRSDHRLIVEAIAARDGEAAAELLSRHLDKAERDIRRHITESAQEQSSAAAADQSQG